MTEPKHELPIEVRLLQCDRPTDQTSWSAGYTVDNEYDDEPSLAASIPRCGAAIRHGGPLVAGS